MTSTVTIPVGSWADAYGRYRLAVRLELRVGDLAGDLATRGFQTVDHEPCPPGALTLSVTHDVRRAPVKGGVWREDSGGAGLPADYLAEIESGGAYATGMTPELARRLVAIAYRWHLNTCRAGCSHMTPLDHESSLGAVLWPGIRLVRYVGSGDPELPYGWRLAEDGLLEADPTTVMLRSLHCSVSDYRYGTAWLIELLPDDLLAELAGLGLTAPEVP